MLPDDDEEDDVKECLHDVDKKWHETGMTLVGLENDDRSWNSEIMSPTAFVSLQTARI